MSIEKIKHLKYGDVVYAPMTRETSVQDGQDWLFFRFINGRDFEFLLDRDIITEQELREKFDSDEIKFGDMVEVPDGEDSLVVYLGRKWNKYYTLWYWDSIFDWAEINQTIWWDSVKKARPKTTLTLSEIEEKLGMESGSLIIKD